MRISNVILALAATALLVTGCARQKNDATNALTSIETSVAALQDDGMKYAPVAYQGVESTLGMLKDSLAKEDYKSVLAGTPKLTEAVTSLKNAIASGKQQFEASTAEWTALSVDVPQMVAAIQSRVDTLGSSRKLPKNVSRESFDGAKSGLDSMKTLWNEASAAATEGNANEAAEKARAVKAKGQEVLTMLGMTGV
jgi:undecaprenyl pyrophosphate synthase